MVKGGRLCIFEVLPQQAACCRSKGSRDVYLQVANLRKDSNFILASLPRYSIPELLNVASVRVTNHSGFCLVDSNAAVREATLSHGIDQSTILLEVNVAHRYDRQMDLALLFR